ncbi:carbon-monoxide dehydrogenase small subunit [Variovorax sp. HW608]|uniref:(2Fe-2S)-binding protein n=1 Tax=Variovorax sp. HW608 TaxID=1034889 RepID=UPI0008200651|nr:(2Fe-2S)-binding protein [Variovorax sp. HW608]SCK14179.1 carbon-monoxide dehydrogenase small subunit [Variovorax sp. HW608]
MSKDHLVTVELRVNEKDESVVVEPRQLLVHLLREKLALTGTHVGCDTTQCGACTVLLDGRAVKSCTVLAVRAQGASVTTIEGLARGGDLHPIQQAFCDHHGLQCGFCTPGFIMSTVQLLARYPMPTEEQIHHQLDGNICRCTGYRGILNAVTAAAKAMADGSDAARGTTSN